MQAYGLTPAQWEKTSPIDRKIMKYKLAMENYYQDIANQKMSAKMKKA